MTAREVLRMDWVQQEEDLELEREVEREMGMGSNPGSYRREEGKEECKESYIHPHNSSSNNSRK